MTAAGPAAVADDQSYSQMLSSTSSLTSSHGSPSTPNITRTYKQASQLFLTRRVPEALQTLEPIIYPPSKLASLSAEANADGTHDANDAHDASTDGTSTHGTDAGTTSSSDAGTAAASASSSSQRAPSGGQAPIATASRGARVKVWSLYISMLNSIVEMGPEEGRKAFGSAARWKDLARRVRDGAGVWDDVAAWGYGGAEAAVDAEVVANLATLLLAHAPSQRPTQARLETYLASTSSGGVPSAAALASRIETSATNGHGHHGHHGGSNGNNGTSTPRDLGSRLKILEIYALHVLPRNEEWEYAKEFVNMSEVLDEERREAFLVALEGLREEHSVEGRKEKELAAQRQREKEAAEERARKVAEAEEERKQKELLEAQQQQQQKRQQSSRQANGGATAATAAAATTKDGINEVDYGVDKTRPNRSVKTGSPSSSSNSKQTNGTATSSSQRPSAASKKARNPPPRPQPTTVYRRATLLLAAAHQSLLNVGVNISRHPAAVLRMLLFLVALVMALARQDVRARLVRARDSAWDKVRRTVGMGVKVSYI